MMGEREKAVFGGWNDRYIILFMLGRCAPAVGISLRHRQKFGAAINCMDLGMDC
jgi:hypothetical protein